MKPRRAGWRITACLAAAVGGFPCASPLSALEWPLDEPRPAATFGTPARGRLLSGLLLAADAGLVRSIGDGELVYHRDGGSSTDVSPFPSTLGSFAIVEHERGIAALYAGLAPGSVSSYLNKTRAESILGGVGSSGWIEGRGLFLALFDRPAARWVNPLLLLPALPDRTPPLIRSAALVREGKSYALGETKSLPQGEYLVALDLFDPLDASWSVGTSAPYYVRLVVDGAKVAELRYDVLLAREGRLVLFPEAAVDRASYLLPDGRAALTRLFFRRGRAVIEALVRDYAGNERKTSWSVLVE